MLLIAFVAVIAAQRLAELVLARRNERWLRARGAVEHGREHYPFFFLLHAAWLGGILAEGWARGAAPVPYWPVWFVVWLAAQAGRYWIIASLGPYWNTRILVLPGGERQSRGPYRYLSHPNYLVVALELLAAPLVFGAWITAVVATVLNAWLLLRVRIPAEEAALAGAYGARQ